MNSDNTAMYAPLMGPPLSVLTVSSILDTLAISGICDTLVPVVGEEWTVFLPICTSVEEEADYRALPAHVSKIHDRLRVNHCYEARATNPLIRSGLMSVLFSG